MDYEQKPDPMLLGLITGRQVKNGLNQSLSNWMNKGSISNTGSEDQIGQNSMKDAKNGSTNLMNPSPVPSFNSWMNNGSITHTRPENQISQISTKNEPWSSSTNLQSFVSASNAWIGAEEPAKPWPSSTNPQGFVSASNAWIGTKEPAKPWPSSTNPQSFVSASNAWIGTKEPAKAPFPRKIQELNTKTRAAKFATKNQEHVKLMTQGSPTPTRPRSWLKRTATNNEELPPPKDKKIKKIEETHFCELCQISCSGPVVMQQHLIGRQHKAKIEYRKLKRGGTTNRDGKGKPMCDVCEIWCPDKDALQMHFNGQKHKAKVKEVEACRKSGGQKSKSSLVMCEVCHVPCMNEELYQMHLKGKQHAWEELKRKGITVWGRI